MPVASDAGGAWPCAFIIPVALGKEVEPLKAQLARQTSDSSGHGMECGQLGDGTLADQRGKCASVNFFDLDLHQKLDN